MLNIIFSMKSKGKTCLALTGNHSLFIAFTGFAVAAFIA